MNNHEKHQRTRNNVSELLYKDEVYLIQGAVFEVYKKMGCGFLEAVYHKCLEIEFKNRNIPFESQKELLLYYSGILLKQKYKPDFICFEKIIIELKAVNKIEPIYKAQVINYLRVTGLRLGLLVNFNNYPTAAIMRFIV